MATLGNLQFEISDNWNSRNLEYDLSDLFSFNEQSLPVFQFDETKRFSVKSSFTTEVSIELELPNGESLILDTDIDYEVVKSPEQGYVPGIYRVRVKYLKHKLDFAFEVLPSAMSIGALRNLRQTIENYQAGLARSMSFSSHDYGLLKNDYSFKNEYELYHEIMQIRNQLINALDKIIDEPITSLSKAYIVGVDQRRSDRRSERWLETKGQRKNDQFENEMFFLNKKAVVEKNNPENRKVKQAIETFRDELIGLSNHFELKRKYYRDSIMSREADITEYKHLLVTSNVQSERDAQERQVGYAQQDIVDLEGKLKLVSEYTSDLRGLVRKCDYYVFDTWLSAIEPLKTSTAETSRLPLHYLSAIKNLEKLNKSMIDGKSIKRPEMKFRSTPYLFEVYNVLLVHQLLINLGFSPRDTTLFSTKMGFVDAISESALIYDKEHFRVELRYDTPIIRRTNHRKTDFYNLNAYHNRPDILIAVFNEHTSTLIDSFIIETKCVKRNYIFSEFEHTKLVEQFNDYLSFCYLDKTDGKLLLKRGVISKLFIVFPDNEQSYSSTTYELINYVGLNPEISIVESKLYDLVTTEITRSLD